MDIGEEDDWSKPAPGASDDEMDEDGSAKKRKKGAKGEAVDAKKGKPVADKRDRQRLANMFAKNAAAAAAGGVKRKTPDGIAAQEGAQDADSLLEDILAGVGGEAMAPAAPAAFRPAPVARRAPLEPIPPAGAAAASVRSGHPRDDDEVHPRDALRAASGRGPRRARHPAGDVRG